MLHATAAGPVVHGRTEPVAELAEVIEHFWGVKWDLRGREPLTAQTLPHPSVHVVIEGARHEVTGVATRRFSRTLEGQGQVFGIKFRPAMVHAVLGAPVSTLANRVVKIGEIFGRAGVRFGKAIEASADPIPLAEAFFLEHRGEVEPLARTLRDLVERAAVDRQWVKVEQLASASGFSVRMLQRYFREYVGVGPKWVLQRYRLHAPARKVT